MNSTMKKQFVFALGMLLVLVLGACGTLQIEAEPAASSAEASPTAAESPAQPTAPTAEETAAVSTALPTLAEAATSEAAESTGGPLTYTNPDYGFVLNYPPEWTAAEVNDEAFVGPGSRSVQFSKGTVTLVVGYRRAGESTAVGGSGAPGGEFEIRGSVQVAGQNVDRYVIVFEGKEKVVMYGEPGAGPIAAGGLEFAVRMDDFAQVDYSAIELSETVQDEADMIVSSLAIIEVGGESEGSGAAYDYTGWSPYSNEALGYSLMHPGETDVMGANRDESVEFVGPVVGTDYWPWFSVQHIDSAFFSPPAGTDVRDWIADSNIPFKAEAQETIIGGLPAVHLRVEGSPQAYGMDEYYVIRGEQLYKITILHTGALEDWELYDQFLQSIYFAPI